MTTKKSVISRTSFSGQTEFQSEDRMNKCPDLWQSDDYTFNVDVYNIGTIAYEIATGLKFDWNESNIENDMIDIYPDLIDFIKDATEINKDERITIE